MHFHRKRCNTLTQSLVESMYFALVQGGMVVGVTLQQKPGGVRQSTPPIKPRHSMICLLNAGDQQTPLPCAIPQASISPSPSASNNQSSPYICMCQGSGQAKAGRVTY